MQNPTKLFEKFTQGVNRATQKEAWENVNKILLENGIYVKNISSLRQNINNWTRRAIVSILFKKYFESCLIFLNVRKCITVAPLIV